MPDPVSHPLYDSLKDFQPTLAAVIALVAATIAYWGATAKVRLDRKIAEKAAIEEKLAACLSIKYEAELAARVFRNFKSDAVLSDLKARFNGTAPPTASAEKREMLQNAVLNSAIGTIDENVRQIFLGMIESMTPMHVGLLKFLNDPKASPEAVASAKSLMAGSVEHVIAAALPKMTENRELFRRLVGDLYRFGLTSRDSFGGTQSGGDSMLNPATTQLGRGLLNFIERPD